MQIRRAEERGHAEHGWLDTWHTFSFASYFDPRHMGFGPLRVINDDVIAPGMGFGEHPHADMEILTYVLKGALRHRDSTGHDGVVGPGGVQWMSAGSGIRHSEFNASDREPVHLLQIWIEPREKGVAPTYGERPEPIPEESGRWVIVSPDGRDGSLTIHQDAVVAVRRLAAGESAVWSPSLGQRQWLHVARGAVEVDGAALTTGDAASWHTRGERRLTATESVDLLEFELP